MKFLTSNFPPLVTTNSTYVERWTELFNRSETINIAVGYASNDSLLYLKKVVELNAPKKLNLCLGMARFEGLSSSQLSAASDLNEFLKTSNAGQVFISNQFPFHGKVQTFRHGNILTAGLVGSSNLSNIVPQIGLSRGNYEVDLLIEENAAIRELDTFICSLLFEASVPLDESTNIRIRTDPNHLMESRFEVGLVSEIDKDSIWQMVTRDVFRIPIKTELKSNLNTFFGKGRENSQGFVKPRHWYEAEIIVGLEVQRSARNYPANKEFIVYTDDGYKFVMKTQGSHAKNLRSREDLTVLGRWLKGRLENAGALTSGKLVTEEVLALYGRNSMTLTRTSERELDEVTNRILEVWTIDFGIQQ